MNAEQGLAYEPPAVVSVGTLEELTLVSKTGYKTDTPLPKT